MTLSGFSLQLWVIYTDNNKNKNKNIKGKLKTHAILKEKNHTDLTDELEKRF